MSKSVNQGAILNWQTDSAWENATRKNEPQEPLIPKYVENALLLDDGNKFNAYYVLRNLRLYGNTILGRDFVRQYGLRKCKIVLNNFTKCNIQFSIPSSGLDTDFYILEATDREKIRVPPELHYSDFKIYTQLFINKVLLLHPKIEQKFYSVMNGSLAQSQCKCDNYTVLMKQNVLVFRDNTSGKTIWLDPEAIINDMYKTY